MEWLKNGSRGDQVKELQLKLSSSGFDTGTIDGIFGPKTEAAVRGYQEKHGLQVDGIAGPITCGSLGMVGFEKPKTARDAARDDGLDMKAKMRERQTEAKAEKKPDKSFAAMKEAEKRAAAETAAQAKMQKDRKDAAEKAKDAPEIGGGFKGMIAKMKANRERKRSR